MFCESGTRKKKSLTDLVKIIPFPGQELRGKVAKKKPVQQASTPAQIAQSFRPVPREVSAPTGKLRSSSMSIKKMMNPVKEDGAEEKIDLSNMPYERYDIDDVKMKWRSYAHKIKQDNKTSFFSALMRRDPILREENVFVLEVDNQAQLDLIKTDLSDFVRYLRQNIKNYDINVILELNQNPDDDVKHLTGKDKFTKLARKNPNLHTLKNKFNLDIEF